MTTDLINKIETRGRTPDWYENHQTLNDFFIDGKAPVDWNAYPDGTFELVMKAFDWNDDEHNRLTKELKEANSTLDTFRDWEVEDD